ncbi:MAG: hypothetical protein A3F68_11280 [Acidobacteria bacterium RIFCSPLOWO2_12_FULL_54_10]|nr:MAG: hypothetical protein A3F68_11280 [Acidobacteria bacterium RIFCSPLOWO2_12_FULL_54_10]
MTTKISVCIPTYNSQRFIRRCLESVLTQSYADFEIIVSDNGSTDSTWDILQSYHDPRLSLFRVDENRGLVYNFNRVMDLARGEYVKILCSDDFLGPSILELQSKFLDEHREVVLVTCDRHVIDETGRPDRILHWFPKVVFLRAIDFKILTLLYSNIIGEPSAVLIRRSAIQTAGPFKEGWSTVVDLDMWLRLSRIGMIGCIPVPLCTIRCHPSSMSSEFHSAGVVADSVWRLAKAMLSGLEVGPLVKRIFWGKVAGSYVRHAISALRVGRLQSSLASWKRGFQIDPGFLGLLAYYLLFRPGVLGMRADSNEKIRICVGSALHCVS